MDVSFVELLIVPGTPRLDDGTTRMGFIVGEVKWSGDAYERAFLGTTPKQAGQWAAITQYAKNHSCSHSALFISLYKIEATPRVELIKKGAAAGVLVIPVPVLPHAK